MNRFMRLWKGDVPLWQTFWGFIIFLKLFDVAARYTIAKNSSLSSYPHSMTILLSAELFISAAGMWCVWQSAKKYTGPPQWKIAARVYATYEFLSASFLMWMYMGGVH